MVLSNRRSAGQYKDAIKESAALLESLLQNHSFLHGNKRTAVACADVHLRLNGLALTGDSADHHSFLVGLIERREVDRERIDSWLRVSLEEL